MIDVGGGYLGNPVVETTGFKMINVSRASISSTKFRTTSKFLKLFHIKRLQKGVYTEGTCLLKFVKSMAYHSR